MNWILFVLLSIIWGSSFILMKLGLEVLSPYQVATIRMLSAGIVLIPFAWEGFKKIPKNKLSFVIVSGLIGSFFPAYLFCIAETKIDSSLAGILNALTPLFTIAVGHFFFEMKANKQKTIGVLVGFAGLCLLFLAQNHINFENISYTFLVLIATLFYGINVNLVGKHLQQIGSLNIAAIAFSFLIIPCLIILYSTGYFSMHLTNVQILKSTGFSFLLGFGGTAIATVLYYKLVKSAGGIFASTVTYGIPFVAVFWGILDGESITTLQYACMVIILIGVWLANKK